MADAHVPGLLHPTRTALLVIDLQTRFAPAIPEFDDLVESAARLCRTFRTLGLPVFATEQYPQGLGSTVPVLRREIDLRDVPSKTVFSSWSCGSVRDGIGASGAQCVLVCGIESHVCVLQTVHELLAAKLDVHVAIDAVGSRRARDRDVALRRMELAGAVLTTSEAAAFELLRDARHPSFRAIQDIHR